MATFYDATYEEIIEGAPRVIREGLTGTRMYVFLLPDKPGRAVIVELNSTDQPMGQWTIVKGRAYRITPNKVRRMPLIENDPDPIRRFCRMNGLPLTRIVRVERGKKVYFGIHQYKGDSNYRSIGENEPPVVIKGLTTTCSNPPYVWKIMVVDGEEPQTWEEFVKIAREWGEVKSGKFTLE